MRGTIVRWSMLALASVAGCASDTPAGPAGHDGSVGRDAQPRPRADECGNGLDDDGDGRIDDGCPCAPGETQACFGGPTESRRAGACADGVQTCGVPDGTEWGDWGDHPCVGDTRPDTETCDGSDRDCDGARDEGCPCTDGDSHECGAEFLTAPCMAGTQRCTAGSWSGCEGAVGPAPDVCGDGVDNDCDGEADEACDCEPRPELCRDGIDNDCDGTIDEPACTPDWPPGDGGVRPLDAGPGDGGVPPLDAGPCDPSVPAPRLLAPSSTSRVTSTRPTLEWELPAGASGAVLALARDRGLSVGRTTAAAVGTSWRPAAPLAPGAHFWQARTRMTDGRMSCDTSRTWELFVPHRDTGTDTFNGSVMDVNGDGFADLGFMLHWVPTASLTRLTRLYLFFGSPTGLASAPDQTLDWSGQHNGVQSCGDVDGDGFGDVIWDERILRGGPGGLDATPFYTIPPMHNDSLGFVGDIDRDGYSDIARRSPFAGDGEIVIYRGGPAALVPASAPLSYAGSTPPAALALGDLTGDRYADIVMSEGNGRAPLPAPDTRGNLWVHEGSAAGIPVAPTRAVVTVPVTTFWGPGSSIDANGDGLRDWHSEVHHATRDTHDLIRFGGPSGLADPPSQDLRASTLLVAVGDTNADGFDDALMYELSYSAVGAGVGLHRGGPAGLELDAREILFRPSEYYVAVGDVDGDGFDDVFIHEPAPGGITYPAGGDPTGPFQIGYLYTGAPDGLRATRRAPVSARTDRLDVTATRTAIGGRVRTHSHM